MVEHAAHPAAGPEEDASILRAMVDGSIAPLMMFDASGRVIAANNACLALAGTASTTSAPGRPVWEILPALDRPDGSGSPWADLRLTGVVPPSLELDAVDELGNRRRVHWTFVPTPESDDGHRHIVATGMDVTAQRIAESVWRQQAETDPLTRLANRTVFRANIANYADARNGLGGGVLFCDLDGFKSINDTYGHAAGDGVLVEVAKRLTANVRPGDLVARFGGDEFAVLLPAVGHLEMHALATRVERFVCRPIRLPVGTVRVGVSIGLAQVAPGDDPDNAMQAADAAMYAVKGRRMARRLRSA